MKTTYFFTTAKTSDAAKVAAVDMIKSFGLDSNAFTVDSAEKINQAEFEVGVSSTVSNIRKLRAALSEGDAE